MLGYEDPELLRMRGNDLQILEYFKIKKGNLAPLTNWLVRLMEADDHAIRQSRLHSALAALDRCKIFYTTNYDDFLERALTLAGRQAQPITAERDMGFGSDAVQVVKFHGDFNSPENMVVSEAHYYDRMRLDGPMDLKLRSDLLGRAVVFIGYSFRDTNIAYLFRTVNAMFSMLPNSFSGKRAYIVFHNPSDFEFSLFNQRNIQIIPTFGNDRSTATSEILEDMAS
ncbi:SIR2-like domain-containing protein [Microvirga guangxiensis]|uniref:SIR2-like domain-containing protein n=2 Tax=Microvirga guangxiensis TaxID=549386 RepID=A0A1G5F6K2_9HYPH|nr:SIR2-like domain-containing protein [Microvirga guangxiensis]